MKDEEQHIDYDLLGKYLSGECSEEEARSVETWRSSSKTNQDEFDRLSPKAEVVIFAVIQEAVNNAKKYAQATVIDLNIQPDTETDTLTVSIVDNGQGFDVRTVTLSYEKTGSLGLINMQERTNTINGTFKIISEVGQGTQVILTVPLNENLLDS